jgi:hypothetical protein
MIGETADRQFDRLFAVRRSNQVEWQPAMVKALRRWLESNELFAIVTGVVGTLIVVHAAGDGRLSVRNAFRSGDAPAIYAGERA